MAHLKSTIYENAIRGNEAAMHNEGSTRGFGLETPSVQNWIVTGDEGSGKQWAEETEQ